MVAGAWCVIMRWQRFWWVGGVVGVFVALLLVPWGPAWLPTAVSNLSHPIISIDIQQQRINRAMPIPQGEFSIEQTFMPQWNGLREIEIIFVRYSEREKNENGRLTLQLYSNNVLLAEESLTSQTLSHNQQHLFRFVPQPHSANQTYTLRVSGDAGNQVAVWGYDLDVYEEGEASLQYGALATESTAAPAKDLYFLTRYQLTVSDAWRTLTAQFKQDGLLLLVALFFLPIPGFLLLTCFQKKGWGWKMNDGFAYWGVSLALGTAVWPLIWFGVTLINGRLTPVLLWLIFLISWLVAIYFHIKKRTTSSNPRLSAPRITFHWQHIALFILLVVSLALRFLAVRHINIAPWVDASRHGLITAVMVENGRTLTDYAPYLPVERFPYHFGFHTIAASLQMMLDWPLTQLLLALGQLLNGLIPLTVYTAVFLLTRRRTPALLAALLVGLPFFFPAYYATWGRFTQLTAMLIMPVLLAYSWLLIRGSHRWQQQWWVMGLLIAGIFYIHFRVFLIYLPFVAIVWLMSRGRRTRWLAQTAVFTLLLILPRYLQLTAVTSTNHITRNTISNYNAFPTSYTQIGWEAGFLWLALAGFLFALLALKRRWTVLPLALAGWVAVLFVVLAGSQLGLPEINLINRNSMYITIFLPLAIFLAVVSDQIWRWMLQRGGLIQVGLYVLLGMGGTAVVLFGIRQQITILNPITILAQPQDLAAIQWVDENLPEDAVIAVNSWKWLGETWAAADGGAWLLPLTGRQTSTPPADYIYNRELALSVREFNETATAVSDWSQPEQADWLQQQDITHIFIGAKGGFFDPAVLLKNPQIELIYQQNGTFVFELTDD